MKIKFLPIVLFIVCFSNLSFGQLTNVNNISPNGIFDKVFNRFGDSVYLKDLLIDKKGGDATKVLGPLCSSGYFDLYFEVGSGMEGNSQIEQARRAVVCQVFSDLSQFIQTPNPNVHVNILIKNINSELPGYNSISNPNPAASSNVAGLASAYYVLPTAPTLPTPLVGGIADNEIWKTINSGVDSYTNFASPLIISGNNPNNYGFYHGYMAINFNNISINWHLDLSQGTGSGFYDLYSVVLHEVTHALGFTSLIASTGNSKFGTSYPYYSRYDLQLKSSSNLPLITNQGSCSMYSFGFNPLLSTSILTPNPAICSSQIRYIGSVNQAAYTPSLFSNESSLSHLEDACHLPNGYPSNQYYVMSYANGTGSNYMKRSLKPEERSILCDLGYKVNPTYGNLANLNYVNYQSTVCPGLGVVGVNDGIDANGFVQYYTNINSTTPLVVSNFLANDFNTNSFECLIDIYGNGQPTQLNSTSFSYSPTTPGIALLRYIPISPTGARGNITYIYIYVSANDCPPTACNLVKNGGFENSNICGQITPTQGATNCTINCWEQFSNTADVFKRNCTLNNNNNSFNIPSSFFSNPATESWDGSPNNTFVGLVSTGGLGSPHWNESIQTQLNAPLIPNHTYTISFKAKSANNYPTYWASLLPANSVCSIIVGGTTNLIMPYGGSETTLPTTLNQLGSAQTILNDNIWHNVSLTFQYTGTSNLNHLVIYNSTNMNSLVNQPYAYVYIDDVQLIESSPTMILDLPQVLCINQSISNLSLYAPIPGGTFSGSGVTNNGNNYSFDPSIAGIGNHIITYTYLNNMNCTIILSDNIEVVNSNFTVNTSASSSMVCPGQSVTLSASSSNQSTYTWSPGNLTGQTVSSIVNANTIFTLTSTSSQGCVETSTIPVAVLPVPTIQILPSNPSICSEQNIELNANGAVSYSWSPTNGLSSIVGSNTFATPVVSTNYSVTGIDNNGCSNTASINVIVNPCNDCYGGTLLTGNINSSPQSGSILRVANNISITGNVSFNLNNVKIMPNVTITVKPNATLSLIGSHLYGCENMWNGIVVEPGGKVLLQPYIVANVIQKTTLIEDAMIAIDFQPILNQQNSFVLISNNATFNKNKTAIRINSYLFSNPSSVFSIKNTLITSRNIYNVINSSWPNTSNVKSANSINNTLLSPYISSAYMSSNLKSPNTNLKSQIGIDLINVGSTFVSSSTTYNSLIIGSLTPNEYNVFDNLNIGINSLNTNLKVQNSIFQISSPIINSTSNTAYLNIISPTEGAGIACKSNVNMNNKIDVTGLSNLPNQFYGLSVAIFIDNLKDVLFNYNIIRSNWPDFQGAPNNIVGYRGVYIRENDQFQNLQVNYNTFYSIRRGISLISNVAGFAPNMSFSNNVFQFKPGITSGNVVSDHAILLENSNSTNQMAGGNLFINNNSIFNIKTGIKASSWRRINLQINSNNISFREFGINVENCIQGTTANQIILNAVHGYTNFSNNENYRAISLKSTIGNIVSCNSVSNSYSGLYFHSNCNPTRTSRNSMTNHKYGFVLDNNGIIGQQGTATNPADNMWLGLTWDPTSTTNGEFKSACLNGSNSINSKMFIRYSTGIYSTNGSTLFSNLFNQYSLSSPQLSLILSSNSPGPESCSIISNPPVSALTTLDIINALETTVSQIADTSYSYTQDNILTDELFRTLESDTNLIQNSFSLLSFHDSIEVSNIGALYDIERALANDNTQIASSLYSVVLPDNQVEESYKLYYEAYINYINGSLSQQDSLNIVTIAQGCPTIQGSAVYLAEALFNYIYIQDTIFIESCPDYIEKSSSDISTNNVLSTFRLFPNPNNGEFSVSGQFMKGQILNIISLDNKQLQTYIVEGNTDQLQIKANLSPGVYFLSLEDESKTLISRRKFIVLK